ncbi:hypothetical protein ACFFX1_12835 [Dactylosporangium sucinum]|uniref:Uncharacterized protein n=1 Tax=Dactylosporangium sucinum TaxID=1424081 RepID=A0A917TWQ4_9ACTN|nr:hypothetical protein [Dactylosporangium sucinum]GGM41269.1 hypothetical protein GCM10007977_048370 [Dactylosporangium sucinum]
MNRLGELLDDLADDAKLYDVTDLALYGATRQRRTVVTARVVLSVLAVVCLVGGVAIFLPPQQFGSAGPPEGGPGRLDGAPPALVQPLLDTPARGSLAGDAGFASGVLDRIVQEPEAFGLPGDGARLRILFAGDVPGNRRLVLVAGVTSAPRMINLVGPRGAKPGRLELTGWSDVSEPVVKDEWRDTGNRGYVLVFGPAGYDTSVSSGPRYRADGTVEREWTAEPAGYVLRDTAKLPAGLRLRIGRGDDVLYEGPVASAGAARTGNVDPAPLFGRGKPAPRAAEAAADALAYQFGLTGPDVHYVVLWSDDFQVDDPNGGGSGLGQIATVMAVTKDGGGPYTTLATDTNPEPNGRNHPTGGGIGGDPAKALIAMRLPTFSWDEPDTLKVIAPPAAVRFEVRRGDAVLANGTLTNGVGGVELPGPLAAVTVRAYDDHDAVVAEHAFADLVAGAPPADPFEPEIKGW